MSSLDFITSWHSHLHFNTFKKVHYNKNKACLIPFGIRHGFGPSRAEQMPFPLLILPHNQIHIGRVSLLQSRCNASFLHIPNVIIVWNQLSPSNGFTVIGRSWKWENVPTRCSGIIPTKVTTIILDAIFLHKRI
uniref:Uncharacterized protein n=1 Tax=Lepeophtheirus salmonis TaxID=72036 RepID=A0A0K2T0S1_LEPSM